LHQLLLLIGFKNIKVITENYTLVFQNAEEYWMQMQRLGWRYYLNKMTTADQEKLKEYTFKKLQSHMNTDGISFEREVLFAYGEK